MGEPLKERVLSVVSAPSKAPGGWTAREVLLALNTKRSPRLERSSVNRALYSLKGEGKVRQDASVPPRWSGEARPEQQRDTTENKGEASTLPTTTLPTPPTTTTVFVDLGNVHDVAQHLEPLAAQGLVEVFLFADLQYNGYPVREDIRHLPVKKATTAHRNAADFWLVWRLRDLVEAVRRGERPPLELVVCTKDAGLHCVEELAQDADNALFFSSISFVNDWEALKPHVL